jgi:hypothetical protein
MKKIFLAIASLSGIILFSSFDGNTAINEKVLHSFHAEYGNPRDARWIAYPNDDYVVFKEKNILVRAEYDLHGNQLYAIRYLNANLLPEPVLDNIKDQYPREKIDVVTEVTNPNGMAYVIQLEDKNSFITLLSDTDGDIAVQNQFHRAG